MWRMLDEDTRFRVMLTSWRCTSCKRMAVTTRGENPAKCGCCPATR